MEETPIKKLIDTWPARRDLANAIGAPVATVHKWAAKGRIPSDWQASVVKAAQAAGMDHVDGDWMVAVHSRDGAAV